MTDKNFKEEVLEEEIPVLVDFWSSWCPPCKIMEPVMQQLDHELNGVLKVCEINIDQNPFTASRYRIGGVPTFILFKDGGELRRRTGAQSRQQLLDMLTALGAGR